MSKTTPAWVPSASEMDVMLQAFQAKHGAHPDDLLPTVPPKTKRRPKRKRQALPLGVKDYITLNSFLRKVPAEHRRYRLPITRGMTMTSYLRRLGQKLGWTRVRLDQLLWSRNDEDLQDAVQRVDRRSLQLRQDGVRLQTLARRPSLFSGVASQRPLLLRGSARPIQDHGPDLQTQDSFSRRGA